MRKINFKVRNIGSEKYLSYILDDDCDFDEELLDYLDENKIPELLDIIYEEDDENDYLTYNVTGRTTVGELFEKTVNAEIVLGVVRGIAAGIVSMRDLGIPVSDVILHKGFTYVNPVTYDVKMICIPIESDTSLNAEFRIFVRNLLANATFDSNEDCNYVARIINLLNVDKFTIREFSAQITELMEAAGMHVDEEYMDISFDDNDEDDGIEVYDSEPATPNNVFKDLDLDAEEKVATSEVDMSAFDDSVLEELDIDEKVDGESQEEEASETEEPLETDEPEASVETKEVAETVEPETVEEDVKAEDAETPAKETESEEEEIVIESVESKEPEVTTEPENAPSATEDTSEEGATEALADVKTSNVTEIAETTEGVTEIAPNEEEQIKPILIDTSDLDNLIEAPPVVKNIRVNRAKIIQKATEEEAETEEKVDNPTEQIVSQEFLESGEPVEPETNMNPVKGSKSRGKSEGTGTTVELPAGMNVVKETAKEEKHAAPGAPKAMPYIVRVNTGERVMINKPVFKLGKATRGVDFSITGNGAISRVHAIISTKDIGCYLKENKATNATYVDGVKLAENQEVKLKHDSTITLGDEDFLFKLS